MVAIVIGILWSAVFVPSAIEQRGLGLDARLHSEFASKHMASTREIIVWLPPGYTTDTEKRYPVLYMHDGQNVYLEWRIDDIAKPLIAANQVKPLIIVMVANGGTAESRADDYTWTKPSNAKAGGKGDAYGRMLVEELKPFIDKTYRTLPDAPNTGVAGASLGGIISLHLGLKYPDVFGRLGVMSPSVWWDNNLVLRDVRAVKPRPPARVWLDIGASEPPGSRRGAQELRDTLRSKGWTLGSDVSYFELPGGTHDEASFARRAGDMLKFLFPPE